MTDWRLVLGRLRPTSAYHWLGDGMNDSYASIGEWRDPETTKPTEQECLDEWDVMLAEWAEAKAQEDLIASAEQSAITDYATLPEWMKDLTAQDATDYINGEIWNGMTIEQIEAYIDANITGTTVAQLRSQLIVALKQTAGAVIAMRGFFIVTIKLLIYLRDLIIRFRKS